MSQTGLQCDKLWKKLWDDKEAERWHLLAGLIFKTWNAVTKKRSWVCWPLPYKFATQQIIPPVGLFICHQHKKIHLHELLDETRKLIDWSISHEFEASSSKMLEENLLTWNKVMELMYCTVVRNRRFWLQPTLLRQYAQYFGMLTEV